MTVQDHGRCVQQLACEPLLFSALGQLQTEGSCINDGGVDHEGKGREGKGMGSGNDRA